MAAIPRYRRQSGPALLSAGFRPFFLFGALWAAIAIPIWLMAFAGEYQIATAYALVVWHAHELVFGYGAAVVAGFLLTAIPNWTGRLPLQGGPLALLLLLWALGRLAVLQTRCQSSGRSRSGIAGPIRWRGRPRDLRRTQLAQSPDGGSARPLACGQFACPSRRGRHRRNG